MLDIIAINTIFTPGYTALALCISFKEHHFDKLINMMSTNTILSFVHLFMYVLAEAIPNLTEESRPAYKRMQPHLKYYLRFFSQILMPLAIALTCFIGVWSVDDTDYDEKGKRIDVLGPEMAFLGSSEFIVMILGIIGMRNYGKYDFERA